MSSPVPGRLVRSLSGPLPTPTVSRNLTGSRSTDVIISVPPSAGDTERSQFSALRSVWLTLQSILSARSDVRQGRPSTDGSVTSSLVVRDCCHDHVTAKSSQGEEECGICLETRQSGELRQLKLCGCRFCAECLSRYVEVRIHDGDSRILCPSSHCVANGFLTAEEVRAAVPNISFLQLYQKLKQSHEVSADPLRVWCPLPDCDTVCCLPDSEATSFSCPSCQHLWCLVCRQQLHSSTLRLHECRPEQLLMPGGQQGGVDMVVKACPHCGSLIERDEGCAQVLCRLCRHAFCWYCLHSLDGDFLLRHYDRGACRGLLGHSRLSLLWHRVLIVCLVLVLVLSFVLLLPLLLAVSPVVFCCFCCCGVHEASGVPDTVPPDSELLDPDADQTVPDGHSPSFTFAPMVP